MGSRGHRCHLESNFRESVNPGKERGHREIPQTPAKHSFGSGWYFRYLCFVPNPSPTVSLKGLLSSQRSGQTELPATEAALGFKCTGTLNYTSKSSKGETQRTPTLGVPCPGSRVFYRVEPRGSLWFYSFIKGDTEVLRRTLGSPRSQSKIVKSGFIPKLPTPRI